jgi:hypothetical protein
MDLFMVATGVPARIFGLHMRELPFNENNAIILTTGVTPCPC